MRINKFLATYGTVSRRQADALIDEGKVMVNGKPAVLGQNVEIDDTVVVAGKPVVVDEQQKVYLMYHKPYGVITTTDDKANNTIIQALNYPTRIFPIGRLDVATSGLILLTNDGDVVNRILKAQHAIEKEYLVTVTPKLQDKHLQKMEQGVELDDGTVTLPCYAQKLSDTTASLTLIEGKNRQVRRMFEAFGYEVVDLQRVRVGGIVLGNLGVGMYKEISQKEFKKKLDLD